MCVSISTLDRICVFCCFLCWLKIGKVKYEHFVFAIVCSVGLRHGWLAAEGNSGGWTWIAEWKVRIDQWVGVTEVGVSAERITSISPLTLCLHALLLASGGFARWTPHQGYARCILKRGRPAGCGWPLWLVAATHVTNLSHGRPRIRWFYLPWTKTRPCSGCEYCTFVLPACA